MVPDRRLAVFVNFATYQPEFAIFDSSIGFFDGAFSIAETFHLAAVQNDATFQRVQDLILKFCFSIFADRFERRPFVFFGLRLGGALLCRLRGFVLLFTHTVYCFSTSSFSCVAGGVCVSNEEGASKTANEEFESGDRG